jgi:hypothetical protein
MIPNIKNKTALTLIGISIIAIVFGSILDLIIPGHDLANILLYSGLLTGQLLGLIMLILNGSIMNTIYWKIIQFCLGIAIIGVLFKIQHWVGSNIIITISFISIVITYAIRFINKPHKGHLDILKVLYVTAAYTCSLLIFQHLIPKDFMTIAHGLFWITLIDFVVTGYNKKTLFEK